VPSSPLTRHSVTQARAGEGSVAPLSSTFHRRLLPLLSHRAIIEGVKLLLRTTALAGVVVLSLLVSACGSPGSRVAQLGSTAATTPSSPSSTAQTTISQSTDAESTNAGRMLAFSGCVREHGVPGYPDPDSSGHLPASGKQLARSSPRFPAAETACAHLLSSGAGTQQEQQQKLAFALKLAQCIRRHGFPTFPDPNGSSQGLPPGIDPNSPQFQAAQTTCQKQEQQALGIR
jgi:hypothetical protein